MNPYVGAWVAFAALGLLVSAYLVRESVHDLRALGDEEIGRIAGRSRLVRESLRATVHLVYLAIGIPALDAPASGVSVVVLGLLWGNVVLLANSLIDAIARRAIARRRDRGESE